MTMRGVEMKTLKVHAKGRDPWALCGYSDRIGEPVTCGVCLRVQKALSNPTHRRKVHAKGNSWRRAICGAWTDNVGEPVTCKTCLRAIEARR